MGNKRKKEVFRGKKKVRVIIKPGVGSRGGVRRGYSGKKGAETRN